MVERRSLIYSAVLHVAAVVAAVIGLPHLFESPIAADQPIAVQLVNLAPKTHATVKNPAPPVPEAKPQLAEAAPPKPLPKPEPPPSPPPPPKTAPAPLPRPKPAPPKPAPAKPQPRKPPSPKPPPPRPPAPKPPAPAPKKPDDDSFNQLLKNLANRKISPPPETPGPEHKSSQPIASLADRLTTSELDVVKQQIEACWNVPAGARDAQNLTPEFRVFMNPDGTVRSTQLLNPENDSFFQAAADSAKRALLNPQCQPLKLPPDQYGQWRTFTITFDPKDIS